MSLKRALAKVFICLMLEIGALSGVPMTAQQIEELMQTFNRTKNQRVIRNETDGE